MDNAEAADNNVEDIAENNDEDNESDVQGELVVTTMEALGLEVEQILKEFGQPRCISQTEAGTGTPISSGHSHKHGQLQGLAASDRGLS